MPSGSDSEKDSPGLFSSESEKEDNAVDQKGQSDDEYDIANAPTQAVHDSPSVADALGLDDDDDDVYDVANAPTQAIHDSPSVADVLGLDDDEQEELAIAATQRVDSPIPQSPIATDKGEKGLFDSSDEEDEVSQNKQKSPAHDASDSDEGERNAAGEEEDVGKKGHADLFSDSEDEDEEEYRASKGKARADESEEDLDDLGVNDLEVDQALYPASDEEQIETVHIDITAPQHKLLKGEPPVLVRMPNFLSIDAKPFDPATYDDRAVEELLDDDGKARVRLRVENTIRWRYAVDADGHVKQGPDGETIKESNARLVKWDDGTMSLVLGNEVFDIKEKSMGNDYNHLYVRSDNMLSGQACFNSRYTFALSDFQSLTHKKLTESVAGKVKKQGRMQLLESDELDPSKRMKEIQQIEEDKLKTRRQMETKRKKLRTTVEYLEDGMGEDDDDDYKRGAASDSEGELEAERRLRKAKRAHSEDEESDEEEEEEEEEEERGRRRKKGKSVFVDSASESEDEEEEQIRSSKKKKQRISDDEDDE